jgi:acetyl-CoA C-acetyltransferase
MKDVVIVSGARTAIGRFQGCFADTPASDLAAAVIKASIERSGVRPEQVDQVVLGCVGQVMEDAYIARHAAVKAGLPIEVPAYTVNRICGSGLEAINTATRWIECGDADVVVAGGAENMTRLPHYLSGARSGYRLGDATVEDGILQVLSDPFNGYHMGVTAENLAAEFEVTRELQDEYALRSQERAAAAIAEGRFSDEIVPLEVKQGRETVVIDRDEHPRATSAEALAKLSPAFREGGSVTAGNASGIKDGAAAVMLMSAAKARERGATARLRLVSRAEAGVRPEIMGSGPIPAVEKALAKAGLTVDDLDVVELNEAFGAVAAACSLALGLDPENVNPNGGAIALGHPVGASGAILVIKLMSELERRHGRYGMVTLCIGGGQGIATIFERVS